MKNWKIILISILLLAGVLRFWQLGERPAGISNDEANYIYSAYSIFKTGRDLNGNFLPLSFTVDTSFSPVNIYMISPVVGVLGPSPFSGRILYALFGVGTIFLLFLLSQKLFKDKRISLAASFVLAVSPWHILVSRSAFDPTPAIFFFLLAIVIFLHKLEKGNIAWSLPFFFLAFNSYHATKVFFIFLIPVLIWIYREKLLTRKKQITWFLVGVLFILISFAAVSKIYGQKRQDVFFWKNQGYIEQSVNRVIFERRDSQSPTIFKKVFSNKPLVFLRDMGANYVSAFSPEDLFFKGDRNRVTGYTLFLLPLMQPIEIIFLLSGFLFLFKSRDKKSSLFIFLSILISPLPGSLVDPGDRSFIFRGIMLLPLFSIVIGAGITYLWDFLNTNKNAFKTLFIIIIFFVYSFLILRSFYIYYFQLSTSGGEYWFESSKDIASVVDAKKNYEIQIVTDDKILPIQIAVFNKIDPIIMQKFWMSKSNKLENVTFLEACSKKEPKQFLRPGHIYISPFACHVHSKPTSVIRDPVDSRIIWKIYEKN